LSAEVTKAQYDNYWAFVSILPRFSICSIISLKQGSKLVLFEDDFRLLVDKEWLNTSLVEFSMACV
jgi:hypothetical protein